MVVSRCLARVENARRSDRCRMRRYLRGTCCGGSDGSVDVGGPSKDGGVSSVDGGGSAESLVTGRSWRITGVLCFGERRRDRVERSRRRARRFCRLIAVRARFLSMRSFVPLSSRPELACTGVGSFTVRSGG